MNKQKGGDRNRYEQTKGWGQKQIRTNKRVGTETDMNQQKGGDRNRYEQTKGWGQKQI